MSLHSPYKEARDKQRFNERSNSMTTLTREQILQGCQTLAVFEDYKFSDAIGCDPNYHTSYDAIRPVWVRFRNTDQSQFTEAQLCEFLNRREAIARSLAYDSHEKAFSLLVEAVEWLNKLKGEQK